MPAFLPLFPLSLVVYPEETLNLHIFEPRYRQLVGECLENGSTFGIPTFMSNKLQNYGTEIRIMALQQQYEDGRMDLETVGVGVFQMLSFTNPVPRKLYAGGEVEFLPLDDGSDPLLRQNLLTEIYRLYEVLKMQPEIDEWAAFLSYKVAHKIGLSLEQEYELLKIPTETDRQEYLLEHLQRAIPVIAEMERTKERIRLNGHFKHFDPLSF
jgi:Lon protease-like protein